MAYRVQVPVGAHIECRLALTRHFALRRSNIKLGAIKFDQMPTVGKNLNPQRTAIESFVHNEMAININDVHGRPPFCSFA